MQRGSIHIWIAYSIWNMENKNTEIKNPTYLPQYLKNNKYLNNDQSNDNYNK